MKIGTITFHWATNYGAVLQSYALQQYLLSQNIETEIIDYIPARVKLMERISWIKNMRFSQFNKEKYIREFRRNELILSKKRFRNNKELFERSNKYDYIITGSDQVWNKGFTLYAEGKTTLSYFLNFAGDKCGRISYAASFGFDVADADYIQAVENEISFFSNISVREETGLSILKQLKQSGSVVCDPTLLIDKNIYEQLADRSTYSSGKVFPYILHKKQHTAMNVFDTIKMLVGDNTTADCANKLSVYDWLKGIRDSDIVVTNSFHAVIFCLIFNTNFIVVPVNGSKMNNRITTILNKVGLLEHFIETNERKTIESILNKKIDWEEVDKKVIELQKEGQNFIMNAIGKIEYNE